MYCKPYLSSYLKNFPYFKALAVQESLEYDMELLCLTGVEDKLQVDVKPTLELLRNAGIKVSSFLNINSIVINASCIFLLKICLKILVIHISQIFA